MRSFFISQLSIFIALLVSAVFSQGITNDISNWICGEEWKVQYDSGTATAACSVPYPGQGQIYTCQSANYGNRCVCLNANNDPLNWSCSSTMIKSGDAGICSCI
jgi:hypothetical protein